MHLDTMKDKLIGSALMFGLMMAGCTSANDPADTVSTLATIDLANTQQVIRGFGAANILPWRPDMTADEVTTAFGTGEGEIGFTLLRLRIPPDTAEFGLQVATAQLAHSLGVIIIASPWSPPASMKSNNSTIGGELKTDSYAAYAAHLKAFANYMSGNGVPLYAVSVQNEPDVSVTYESCDWSATQMLNFVKSNASAVGVKIIAPESYIFDHAMSDPMLNDDSAAANVSIIGGHIYGGGLTSYPLAMSKGKEVWNTEHLDTNTSWSNVLATGKEINDCMNASMNAYIWWYIVRFYGPIDDGERGGTKGNVTKRGYVMSQYARFIRPGYFRINATANPQTNVDVTAYKSSSKVVIVALNRNSTSVTQTFVLQNGTVTSVTPYITSRAKNCAQESDIAVESGRFTATLDALSVTTFVSD